jgi:hypothetical protein
MVGEFVGGEEQIAENRSKTRVFPLVWNCGRLTLLGIPLYGQ